MASGRSGGGERESDQALMPQCRKVKVEIGESGQCVNATAELTKTHKLEFELSGFNISYNLFQINILSLVKLNKPLSLSLSLSRARAHTHTHTQRKNTLTNRLSFTFRVWECFWMCVIG